MIVIGTVKQVLPDRWDTPAGGRPADACSMSTPHNMFRPVLVEVEQYVKGEQPQRIVQVYAFGGTVGKDKTTYRSSSLYTFREGERVVLGGPDVYLTGLRKQPLSDGRAVVALRPEEITVLPRGVTGEGNNIIEGTIENVEYGGRDSLLDVVTPAGVKLHARAPGTHKLGDPVRMQVPLDRVLVYPHE